MPAIGRAALLRLLQLAPCLPLATVAAPDVCTAVSLSEATMLIRKGCDPAFLAAVRYTGRFLYRGEGLTTAARCTPRPDLLLPGTYADPDALDFFRRLEDSLPPTVGARPSAGHLGTASLEAAGVWGSAASIWPLGRLTYAWPADRSEFWPRSSAQPAEKIGARSIAAPPLSTSHWSSRADGLVIDRGLDRALAESHEVMPDSPPEL